MPYHKPFRNHGDAACERTRNEAPNVGYTAVFPLATILKIVPRSCS